MSNCIDERVVLFVAAYFANEESGIEDQSKDQEEKEYDPENKQRHFPQVENDPTDVQRNCQRDKACPKRDEESY